MIFKTILYYFLFVPIVLCYGVGERKIFTNLSTQKLLFTSLKMLLCTTTTCIASYFVCEYILVPLSLMSLASVVCLILYLLFSLLTSLAFYKFDTDSVMEIAFPAVLISVTEANSFLQSITICFVICISLFCCLFLFSTIMKRLKSSHPLKEFSVVSVLFITIAIVLIAFYSVNISWITWLR